MKKPLLWLALLMLLIISLTGSPKEMIMTKRFGLECTFRGYCGEMYAVNCKAESGGPFYYVSKSHSVVATCGSEAKKDHPAYTCPPKGWVCPAFGSRYTD